MKSMIHYLISLFSSVFVLYVEPINFLKISKLAPQKREYSSDESQKLSILVPAPNREKFIGRLLKSLTKQDSDNFEVLALYDKLKLINSLSIIQVMIRLINIIIVNYLHKYNSLSNAFIYPIQRFILVVVLIDSVIRYSFGKVQWRGREL